MKDKKLTPEVIWKRYTKGLSFNSAINLDEEVENNENFFIGKQWEGVQSNGLPTPVFNFLKRVTLFTVACVASDNIKMQATPIGGGCDSGEMYRISSVLTKELATIFEVQDVPAILREFTRNAAVDGDACTYTYWDPEMQTGQAAKGGIVTEIVENNRVFFGNPNIRQVQRQPYIIIERTAMLGDVRKQAEELGIDPELIHPDTGDRPRSASDRLGDEERVTVLMHFYRDKDGFIHCCETTRNVLLLDRDLGLTLYPITWLCWDYRRDNYHGQSLISGLIPNQIFINKLFAMSMISLMTTAYPKIIYDKTRISHWDNRVGAAIGINGGDVSSAAKIIDPAAVSPQIAEFIRLAVDYTETFLGATPAALGDVNPNNASAILALQRASATPHEITRRNLYASVEELGRIYVDFMAAYYGERVVNMAVPKDTPENIAAFVGSQPGGEMEEMFDFSCLKDKPMRICLDVGASAYWSEIASMQTLDNLLSSGQIQLEDYLERIPDGYISMRRELIEKLRSAKSTMGEMKDVLSQLPESENREEVN